LGSEVDDEFVPLLLEQGGFQRSQPTLPRTVPIPETMNVAIIGAGLAGIIAALAAADAGVAYQIFERNNEVGGTWLTTTYPGIGVDTPSAYYSLSREVTSWRWPTSTGCASTPDSAPRSRPCGGTRTARSGRFTPGMPTATVRSAMPAW
jgi:hypothetical protein